MTRLQTLLVAIAATLLLVPGPAEAKRKPKSQPIPEFVAEGVQVIATVEFTQEFVAGGQRQQTRAFTDGFVISSDGLVLISGRVRFPQRGGSGRLSGGSLPKLGGFRLHFSDGREHEAEVVGFDDDLNLGLLKITDLPSDEDIPHVTFGAGYEAGVGTALRTLTLYTEQYGRKPVFEGVMINSLLEVPQDLWSLSGASSSLLGAPLWDDTGKVVGVIAQVPMSPWGGRQVVPQLTGPVGLAYERFADWLAEVSAEARAEQSVASLPPDEDQAWLGIMFQPLEKELGAHLGQSEGGGLLITRVVPGSPAEDAGIQALDVLVELEGARIAVLETSDASGFSRLVRSFEPGQTVVFVRESRNGTREDVAVTLKPTPTSELHAERRPNDAFELTVREATMDTLLSQRLDPTTPGVIVDGVTRAGWAGLSGVGVGMIIQRINEHPVTDLDSFDAALAAIELAKPDKVLFFVRHSRQTRFFVAEPDWDEVESETP